MAMGTFWGYIRTRIQVVLNASCLQAVYDPTALNDGDSQRYGQSKYMSWH